MSSIADRQDFRAKTASPDRPRTSDDTYFWIGLAVVAVAAIVSAFVGAHYAAALPADMALIGP
jgi:hypothetical protein